MSRRTRCTSLDGATTARRSAASSGRESGPPASAAPQAAASPSNSSRVEGSMEARNSSTSLAAPPEERRRVAYASVRTLGNERAKTVGFDDHNVRGAHVDDALVPEPVEGAVHGLARRADHVRHFLIGQAQADTRAVG